MNDPPRRSAWGAGALAVAERLHVRIFRHEMSAEMARFLHNLSWSVVGGVLGAGAQFAAIVVAGRMLGPAEYGQVSLVLVLSQAFAVLGAWGLDVAGARTLPRSSPPERRAIASTASVVVVITLGVTAVVAAALAPVIADLAGTSTGLVLVAVAVGVAFGTRTMLERLLGGLELFRAQSLGRVAEGLTGLALVALIVVALDRPTWTSVVVATNVATVLVLVLFGRTLRPYLRPRAVDRESLRLLSRYARIVVLHTVTGLGFVYGDRLIVHDQLGAAQLGIYTAYYTASYLVVNLVMAITANVLFPAAARLDGKAPLIAKLRRLRLLATLPAALGLMVVTYAVLSLFGSGYPFSLPTAALSSTWGALLLFNGLFTVLTVTHSERTYLLTALFQGVRSVVFVAYLAGLVLADATSVRTVLLGLILIEILDALNLETIIRRHLLTA